METAKITIRYEDASQNDLLNEVASETLAEMESIRRESEEIAELRRIVFEVNEHRSILYTST